MIPNWMAIPIALIMMNFMYITEFFLSSTWLPNVQYLLKKKFVVIETEIAIICDATYQNPAMSVRIYRIPKFTKTPLAPTM